MTELFKLTDHLFIKPLSRVAFTVKISSITQSSEVYNRSLSNWEIIQKIKQLCPSILTSELNLKLERSSLEYLRFICDLSSRSELKQVISRVDKQFIKLTGFTKSLSVRAVEFKSDYPRPHDWTAFFRDTPNLDESLPGQRPDTVIIKDLPIRWFLSDENSDNPSEQLVIEAFKCFGEIRKVDIPMLDPVQNVKLMVAMRLTSSDIRKEISYIQDCLGDGDNTVSSSTDALLPDEIKENSQEGFGKFEPASNYKHLEASSPLTFTAYVQYAQFIGFSKAIEALRGVKLLYSTPKELIEDKNQFSALIKLNFDRSQHLSDKKIRLREHCRLRLTKLSRKRLEEAIGEEERRIELEKEKRKNLERLAERDKLLRISRKRAREEEEAARVLKAEKERRKRAQKHCRREKAALQDQINAFKAHDSAMELKKEQSERLISALNRLIENKIKLCNKKSLERKDDHKSLPLTDIDIRNRMLNRREEEIRLRLLKKLKPKSAGQKPESIVIDLT